MNILIGILIGILIWQLLNTIVLITDKYLDDWAQLLMSGIWGLFILAFNKITGRF